MGTEREGWQRNLAEWLWIQWDNTNTRCPNQIKQHDRNIKEKTGGPKVSHVQHMSMHKS